MADFTVIIHCYLTLVLLLPNAPEDGICVYCKRKVTNLSKSLLLSEKPVVQASFLCRPPFSPKVRCKFSMHAHNVSYCKSIALLFTTTGPGMGVLFHRRIDPVLFILLYHFIYLHIIYIIYLIYNMYYFIYYYYYYLKQQQDLSLHTIVSWWNLVLLPSGNKKLGEGRQNLH